MKTNTPLEEKLCDVETRFPGVCSKFKSYNKGNDGRGWGTTGLVLDVEYAETQNFHVAVARWHEEDWDMENYGGVIQYNDWMSVHFRGKGKMDSPILDFCTPTLVTRSAADEKYDLQELWQYKFVSIITLANRPDLVKVAWVEEQGREYHKQLSDWNTPPPTYFVSVGESCLISTDGKLFGRSLDDLRDANDQWYM